MYMYMVLYHCSLLSRYACTYTSTIPCNNLCSRYSYSFSLAGIYMIHVHVHVYMYHVCVCTECVHCVMFFLSSASPQTGYRTTELNEWHMFDHPNVVKLLMVINAPPTHTPRCHQLMDLMDGKQHMHTQ